MVKFDKFDKVVTRVCAALLFAAPLSWQPAQAQGASAAAPAASASAHAASAPAPAASAAAQGTSATPPGGTPAPANAYLYIGWPVNNQTVQAGKPVRVWFGLRNMGVAPRGVKFPKTGHHHLLIDVDLPPLDKEIPNDRQHLHFGAGETETSVELAPGKHTLQLLMGDDKHIPHNPPVYSKKITIYVR